MHMAPYFAAILLTFDYTHTAVAVGWPGTAGLDLSTANRSTTAGRPAGDDVRTKPNKTAVCHFIFIFFVVPLRLSLRV